MATEKTLQVKPGDLSKKALVGIVEAMLKSGMVRDGEDMLRNCLKHDLISQLHIIKGQLKTIDKQLNKKNLSRKAHNSLVKKHNNLIDRGNKKLELLKQLDPEAVANAEE